MKHVDVLYDFEQEGDLVAYDELKLPDDKVISSWEDIEEPMKRKIINGEVYVENFTGGPAEAVGDGEEWIRPATLAERFRDLCDATGMTGKALSVYAGVTEDTICNYRRGRSPVSRSVWRLVESRKL